LEKAELDAMDSLTLRTILLAVDNQGHIFPFLDGIYPLGILSVGRECGFLEFVKHPSKHTLMGQLQYGSGSNTSTYLKPTILTMPLLSTRRARDLAKLSSTARELVWYLIRVVKEMREAWFGSESQTGAREFGPKWVHALEAKQKEFSAGKVRNLLVEIILLNEFLKRMNRIRSSILHPFSLLDVPLKHFLISSEVDKI
jgi:anaphase-promoting complex subunit 4